MNYLIWVIAYVVLISLIYLYLCCILKEMRKSSFNILASIATILAIILALFIAQQEIDRERESDLDDLVSRINLTINELNTNINISKATLEFEPLGLTSDIGLIDSNLDIIVTDGRIKRDDVRRALWARSIEIDVLNRRLEELDSTGFILLNISNYLDRRIDRFNEKIAQDLTILYNESLPATVRLLEEYRGCLDDKKDYTKC